VVAGSGGNHVEHRRRTGRHAGQRRELSPLFSDAQVIELCLTAGWYHAISYVVNVARVPLEAWAARFPVAAGVR